MSESTYWESREYVNTLRSELTALRAELEQVKQERDALKLSTCSTLWWEDGDRSFDSPEYYAEERGLKMGDEFELQGARYRDEQFRVTKLPDETNDDWECEEITAPKPDEFEPYFSMQKRAEAAESENKRLREALVAARDVIAALQKQLGVVPGQNGYSATMTAGEIQAAKAVQDLDEIIASLRGE